MLRIQSSTSLSLSLTLPRSFPRAKARGKGGPTQSPGLGPRVAHRRYDASAADLATLFQVQRGRDGNFSIASLVAAPVAGDGTAIARPFSPTAHASIWNGAATITYFSTKWRFPRCRLAQPSNSDACATYWCTTSRRYFSIEPRTRPAASTADARPMAPRAGSRGPPPVPRPRQRTPRRPWHRRFACGRCAASACRGAGGRDI
jgi:hypothetical protein